MHEPPLPEEVTGGPDRDVESSFHSARSSGFATANSSLASGSQASSRPVSVAGTAVSAGPRPHPTPTPSPSPIESQFSVPAIEVPSDRGDQTIDQRAVRAVLLNASWTSPSLDRGFGLSQEGVGLGLSPLEAQLTPEAVQVAVTSGQPQTPANRDFSPASGDRRPRRRFGFGALHRTHARARDSGRRLGLEPAEEETSRAVEEERRAQLATEGEAAGRASPGWRRDKVAALLRPFKRMRDRFKVRRAGEAREIFAQVGAWNDQYINSQLKLNFQFHH